MEGFPTGKFQTLQHVPFPSRKITALVLVCLRDESLTFSLARPITQPLHWSQMVIPLAIRSLIKGLHSDDGNKGDGGDRSEFGHSMAQAATPSKTVYRASRALDKSAFDKRLTALGVRRSSKF